MYVFNYVFTMNTNIAKYFPNFCCHQVDNEKLNVVRDEINNYPGKKRKNEILPFATT